MKKKNFSRRNMLQFFSAFGTTVGIQSILKHNTFAQSIGPGNLNLTLPGNPLIQKSINIPIPNDRLNVPIPGYPEILVPKPELLLKRRWIWLLSGGGAKGCFQVGALLFLRENYSQYRPVAICGTSVGALNSILPAEGEDSDGIPRLRDIWLSLQDNDDMYSLSPAATGLDESILTNLAGLGTEEIANSVLDSPYLPSEEEEVPLPDSQRRKQKRLKVLRKAGAALGIFSTLPVSGPILAGLIGKDLSETYREIKQLKSLYVLDPIDKKLQENIDVAALNRAKNLDLRMCSVALENGAICWMNKFGEFTEQRVSYGGNVKLRTYKVPETQEKLVRIGGAIASASIPLAFPPVPMPLGDGKTLNLVDGGVQDVLPTRSAVPIIENLKGDVGVISIYASPIGKHGTNFVDVLGEPTNNLSSQSNFDSSSILEITSRSISLQRSEVGRTDLLDISSICRELQQFVIAPLFSINGTGQIDPGLIRIQMAYGWMTAFDTINWRMPNVPTTFLSYNTQQIIRQRMNIWRYELRFRIEENRIIWGNNILQDIRLMKERLAKFVRKRIQDFGENSLPIIPEPGDALSTNFSSNISSWWLSFEKHQPDPEIDPALLSASPWSSGMSVSGPVQAASPPEPL